MISIKSFVFALCSIWVVYSNEQQELYKILPHISMKEFHQNLYDSGTKANYFDKLRDGGGVFSAFVITDMDETYSQALIDFQSSAPSCMKSIERNQIFELPLNEENHRLTFATITKHFPDCFNHKVLSKTFDQVDVLITKFIEILVNKQLTYEENGSIYDLVEAPIKDHIHVYFNNISSTSNKKRRKWVSKTLPEDYYMVPFHVDNGLYLMITPFSNHGLQIQHSDGEIISSSNLDTNSLIILFGRGLTEWLLQTSRKSRENFFPAPHAVPSFTSPTISYRSVYARGATHAKWLIWSLSCSCRMGLSRIRVGSSLGFAFPMTHSIHTVIVAWCIIGTYTLRLIYIRTGLIQRKTMLPTKRFTFITLLVHFLLPTTFLSLPSSLRRRKAIF